MPIRPENLARYPANWKTEIRPRILDRANHACEGSPDFPDCRRPNGAFLNRRTGELTCDGEVVDQWTLVDEDHVTKIVLTIAHLDHVPEHCDDDNLRAWCQRCHLHYDRHHHRETRQATRRSKSPQMELIA